MPSTCDIIFDYIQNVFYLFQTFLLLYNYCEVNDETVGITEYGNTQITVFPNPTTGFVTIATSLQVDISIYNAFGQLVLQENNAKQIDITSLSDGIYQMILTYDGNKFTKKIIKQWDILY